MEETSDIEILPWLQDVLKKTVLSGSNASTFQDGDDVTSLTKPRTGIPSDQLPNFQELVDALIAGRRFIAVYNYVLLAILAAFTVIHLLEKRRCRTPSQAKTSANKGSSGCTVDSTPTSPSALSSSTSSSPRITTPSGALKDSHIDIERLPLLGLRPSRGQKDPTVYARTKAHLLAFLEYQPRPLPLVKRLLPSNGTSVFVGFWLAINIFFQFYELPLGLRFTLLFSARAGDAFIANLPLLYLLAAKNQPLKLLTGLSYEALNIFHRRVGEWVCLQAAIHTVGEVLWRLLPGFAPDWFGPRPGLWEYLHRPIIYYGLGAFVCYELLYFTSLGSFRQRCYEIFLASHIILQTLALGFLFKHVHIARPWVLLALTIFLVDRLVWRMGLKSTTVDAELEVLPDGETIVLVATWHRPTSMFRRTIWPRQNIRTGWRPTDHVFLTVPILGRAHALQAHPFTIASAAPGRGTTQAGHDSTRTPQINLRLLIRTQSGFTASLLHHAHRHRTVRVRLDGPYGSSHALDMLRAADNACLVAGGSGIAVTFPLAWALLKDSGRIGQRVRMLWIIHCEEHRQWIPARELEELVAAGLELVVPKPTAEAGRPDVEGLVEQWIVEEAAEHGQTAVAVSGPDGLNRMVRNTCAAAIRRGLDVRLAVEKFGW